MNDQEALDSVQRDIQMIDENWRAAEVKSFSKNMGWNNEDICQVVRMLCEAVNYLEFDLWEAEVGEDA